MHVVRSALIYITLTVLQRIFVHPHISSELVTAKIFNSGLFHIFWTILLILFFHFLFFLFTFATLLSTVTTAVMPHLARLLRFNIMAHFLVL